MSHPFDVIDNFGVATGKTLNFKVDACGRAVQPVLWLVVIECKVMHRLGRTSGVDNFE